MIEKMLKICGVVVLLVALLSEKCDATCLCPFDSSNVAQVEAYEELLQALPMPTPPPSPYSFVRETTYPGLDYSDPNNPELCECEVQKVIRCTSRIYIQNPPQWDPSFEDVNSQVFFMNADQIKTGIQVQMIASVELRDIFVRSVPYRFSKPVMTIDVEIQLMTDPGGAADKVRNALLANISLGQTFACFDAEVDTDPLATTTTTSTTTETTTTTEANDNDDQEEEEDPNYLLFVTVPSACGIIFIIFICLCCTRNDSRFCNFCSGESDQSPIV